MITRWNLPYTVTRKSGAGTWVKGRYNPPAESQFEIQATIQPLSDREVLMLPEAERTREKIKIYSATELNPAQVNGADGDIIAYDGNIYEITGLRDWNKKNGIKHFKMIGTKIDPNADDRKQA